MKGMNNENRNAQVDEPTLENSLGSDAPQIHPSLDEFGYAPFARAIARAVRTTPSPKGLVMAVDGPWGAGKTSLLNFVAHYLTEANAPLADGLVSDTPVIVAFNPWWFADGEQLAMQYLRQLRARFPSENAKLMAVADTIAEYADTIGSAVEKSIATTGFAIPLLGPVISWLLKKLRGTEKDVPTLKAEVSEALSESHVRFVVFVDDIDRLAPDEVREVFTVIKAVADFPNVVYLLAFDRKLVSGSLQASLGIDNGDAYLEKIVQAQFVLPAVSHELLIQKLLRDLDRLIGTPGDDEFPVDPAHWANVLHDGLASLVQTPRDVVRVVNALMVTFPSVRGEVNPVDFIAIEFLRVFVPAAYAVIRDNKEKFTGASDRGNRDEMERFHDGWLESVAIKDRGSVKSLVKRLFPRLQFVWDNVSYGENSLRRWSAKGLVCAPEKFDRYFQFSVAPDTLSERQIRAFVNLGDNVDALANAWLEAFKVRRAAGTCKASDLINALVDFDDLPEPFALACTEAFFRVGDTFIADPRNSLPGFFSVHADIQAFWLINHLAARIPDELRETTFIRLARDGDALGVALRLTYSITGLTRPDATQRDSIFQTFAPEAVQQMKDAVIARVRHAAENNTLTALPDVYLALLAWSNWVDVAAVQNWLEGALQNDDTLLKLLVEARQIGTSHTLGEHTSRRIVSINPKTIGQYLPPTISLEDLSRRVQEVSARRTLSDGETEAVREFARGMEELLKAASSPDDATAPENP